MDCCTPGFPVLHYVLELAQTHVHWISDAIQRSPPQLRPSPSALNLSQHRDLFQWVGSSHQVAKVLELQPQHQYFQWTFRVDLLAVQGTFKSSPAPQFESINSSALSLLYGPTLTSIHDCWEKHSFVWDPKTLPSLHKVKILSSFHFGSARRKEVKPGWLVSWNHDTMNTV